MPIVVNYFRGKLTGGSTMSIPKHQVTAIAIRRARDALGETQGEFAARIGINQATVSRWETGRLPKKGVAQALLRRVMEDIERMFPLTVRK
jgi:DNA-binding transcriptional regulator YiaG